MSIEVQLTCTRSETGATLHRYRRTSNLPPFCHFYYLFSNLLLLIKLFVYLWGQSGGDSGASFAQCEHLKYLKTFQSSSDTSA